MATINVQGDPMWAKTGSNLMSLFDPRMQAEGDLMRGRLAASQSESRYNDARTGMINDRLAALSPEALTRAGYTPRQIAAIRATQTERVSDLFGGVQADIGTEMLTKGGDPLTASILLGQGTASDDIIKALSTQRIMGLGPGQTFNAPLAATIAGGGPAAIGGAAGRVNEAGQVVLDALTPQGNLYNAQAKAEADITAAKVATEAARKAQVETKTTNMGQLTDAQIELLRQKGVAIEVYTDARIEALKSESGARVAATEASTANRTRETDARIARINANIDNDRVKAEAAVAAGTDPVKRAQAQATLRNSIDNVYAKDFSENLGKPGVWEQVDPAQKKSLTDRALEYIMKGADLGTAMKQSEADHGLTGKTVKGQKSKFFGLSTAPDGKITFEGFTPPSPIAAAVSSAAAPAPSAPAPASPAPAPAPAAAVDISAIPAGAIAKLKENPSLATDFDKKYGVGASAAVLGTR